RRQLLQTTACGFGHLALTSMLSGPAARAAVPDRPPGHHAARAKRVIFLFMQGGPSQVDTYDYKPELFTRHDQKVEFFNPRHRKVQHEKVFKPLWEFKQHGQTGHWASSLFPEVNKHIDDLCFIHSMHTEGVAHGPATLFLHTGATNLIRPSVGAWISYGLGSENDNLPAFVTINPPANKGGPRNYSHSFLPAIHQGTVLGQPGNVRALPEIRNIESPLPPAQAEREHAFVSRLNRAQIEAAGDPRNPHLESAVKSLELAWRMQSRGAGLIDLDREPQHIHELYGIGNKTTESFGRQCLAARQLVEAGVRYIQVSHCDNSSTPVWDQHSNLPRHEPLAREVDQPIAGLLTDLRQRGLLEDTLVWWGAEFGRTPFSQNNNGRDHNPRGFTTWLAGGG
ncbi:MAG: DUF1501 domain-containing protein, partial [Akkermansiaceae bacterium]|nr:DUF1501 domain-containing protein [Akkermansiaceae bacterium]